MNDKEEEEEEKDIDQIDDRGCKISNNIGKEFYFPSLKEKIIYIAIISGN